MNYDTSTMKGLIQFLKSLNPDMKVNKLKITTNGGQYHISEATT